MNEILRVDNNDLHKLVSGLIVCGFRGSAQEVANEHIDKYLAAQNEIRVAQNSTSNNTESDAIALCKKWETYKPRHDSESSTLLAALLYQMGKIAQRAHIS